MTTITIPKAEFNILKKRASLYDALLQALPERRWGIEKYSSVRLKEFARSDRLGKRTRRRLQLFFASRK